MMSIYIPTIDDKANGIPSSHKLGLNIFRDFGFTDRDYYQFSIYLAEEIKNQIVDAIDTQRFVNSRKYKPLSKAWYRYKQKNGLSLKFWEATGYLKNLITVYRSNDKWVIGINKRLKNNDVYYYQILKFLEFGTVVRKKDGSLGGIPPRPLFQPVFDYVSKNIRMYVKKYIQIYKDNIVL